MDTYVLDSGAIVGNIGVIFHLVSVIYSIKSGTVSGFLVQHC